MHKEIRIPRTELEPLAEDLARVFFQRRDFYARQLDDGRYIFIKKPLETWQLVSHLQGKLTLGTYVLSADSQARFIAFDADDNQQLVGLIYMAQSLLEDGVVPTYLESSRRGGHLWLFFDRPIPGREVQAFGRGLLAAHYLEGIELFPKQDQLSGGTGSLIRLPFGIHRRDGRRYGFINLEGQPIAPTLADQIRLLSSPQTVPENIFDDFLELGYQSKPKPEIQPSEGSGKQLSSRIKDSVTVLDFVSRYVELSPNGRGLCPFHDDKQPSFSVNDEENFWNCFAGCGGGSVIDFWMKFQDCDFKTAVQDLQEMILAD